MKKQKNLGFRKQVENDKSHIKEFLRVHKIHLVNNRVSYLFKAGDIIFADCNATIRFNFQNLWEIEGDPEKVKVEFTIDLKGRKRFERWLECEDKLINKIVDRAWPDNPINPQTYLEESKNTCKHHREINLAINGKLMKVTIIANLCYCNREVICT